MKFYVMFPFVILVVLVRLSHAFAIPQNLKTVDSSDKVIDDDFHNASYNSSHSKNSCYLALTDIERGLFSPDGRIKIIAEVRDTSSPLGRFIEISRMTNHDSSYTCYAVPHSKLIRITCWSRRQITLKFRGLLPTKIENSKISRQTITLADEDDDKETFCYELVVQLKGRPSATGTYECIPNENDSGINASLEPELRTLTTSSAALHLFVRSGGEEGLPRLLRPRSPGITKISPGSETGTLVIPCLMDSCTANYSSHLHLCKKLHGSDKLKVEGIEYNPTVGFILTSPNYTCGDTFFCHADGLETRFEVTCPPKTSQNSDYTILYKRPINGSTIHECHNTSKSNPVSLIKCQSRIECEFLKPSLQFGAEEACSPFEFDPNTKWDRGDNTTASITVPSNFRGLILCSNDHYVHTTYILSDLSGELVKDINFSTGSTPGDLRWIASRPSEYSNWNNARRFHQFNDYNFTCATSKLYGALDMEWSYELDSGDRIPAMITAERLNVTKDVYISDVTLNFDRTDITKLICKAPRIYSDPSPTRWHELSENVTIKRHLQLTISGEQVVNLNIQLSTPSSKRSVEEEILTLLTCQANGHSVRITWFKNNKKLVPDHHFLQRVGNTTLNSSIAISNDQLDQLEDTYRCEATDIYNNTAWKEFAVTWVPPFPWKSVFIAVATILGIALLVTVLVIGLDRYHLKQRRIEYHNIYHRDFLKGNPDDTTQPSFWRAPFQSAFSIKASHLNVFQQETFLGKGNSGVVFKGQLLKRTPIPIPVAVKQIKVKHRFTNVSVAKDFFKEIKALCRLNQENPHLVKFYGACHDKFTTNENASAVLEFCKHGSIKEYLGKRLGSPRDFFYDEFKNGPIDVEMMAPLPRVTTSDLCKWAYQIACGMEYLASQRFVHRDLAARNVLLDADENVKITDFGLARRMRKRTTGFGYYGFYKPKSKVYLPPEWVALEAMYEPTFYQFTVETDVWAFGVTLWEIFGLCQSWPYSDEKYENKNLISARTGLNTGLLRDFLLNGNRLAQPAYASPEIWTLIQQCWNAVPSSRPDFGTLKDSTKRIAEARGLNTGNYCNHDHPEASVEVVGGDEPAFAEAGGPNPVHNDAIVIVDNGQAESQL